MKVELKRPPQGWNNYSKAKNKIKIKYNYKLKTQLNEFRIEEIPVCRIVFGAQENEKGEAAPILVGSWALHGCKPF